MGLEKELSAAAKFKEAMTMALKNVKERIRKIEQEPNEDLEIRARAGRGKKRKAVKPIPTQPLPIGVPEEQASEQEDALGEEDDDSS